MVFIILLGAAMLTSAFRGFGGEELVKEHLTSLPGGFWTQFIVVMAVIFFLGFFLDFLEIAVVVVPIVAPILLADPGANVTAVWFGVMVGLNIQTSFLTPPFGFALFYLRGVAPKSVTTIQIYKGAAAFIVLQLIGLAIAGAFPSLVNYLPNKTHLTSETAPPPSNPKLQQCLEDYIFADYDLNKSTIIAGIERIKTVSLSHLPDEYQERLNDSYKKAGKTFAMAEEIRVASSQVQDYSPGYRPLHIEVRRIQKNMRKLEAKIAELTQDRQRISNTEPVDETRISEILASIAKIETEIDAMDAGIPGQWEASHAKFVSLAKAEKKARQNYRRNVDESYEMVVTMRRMIAELDQLEALEDQFPSLFDAIQSQSPDNAMKAIKIVGAELDNLTEMHRVKSKLSKSRKALRGDNPDREKSLSLANQALEQMKTEIEWHQRAAGELAAELAAYDQAIARTIGMRMQERLTQEQAESIASCLAVHKDLTLHF
jgi:hypothetical protein